jgi:hypothetical protein
MRHEVVLVCWVFSSVSHPWQLVTGAGFLIKVGLTPTVCGVCIHDRHPSGIVGGKGEGLASAAPRTLNIMGAELRGPKASRPPVCIRTTYCMHEKCSVSELRGN